MAHAAHKGPTIALCMIVRDEEAVIERCISSVRGLVDRWVIVDTGSVDDTPALIETALAGVPGTLHHREWRDFGANRTELMQLARGAADYLLLLDADMTLEQRGELPELTADAYLLRHAGDLAYWIPRLVRGDRDWRFEAPTHEYLASDDDFTQERLGELLVVHHADGGTREEKLTRDARLLERRLEHQPDDPRSLFYLAQTLADAGETDRAIALYQRRTVVGGWDEEAFYAAFQAGSLRSQSDPVKGARGLIAAAAMRPTRAEPLLALARLCRVQGWHDSAYAFALRGAAIPFPDGDLLFVHADAYTWSLRFELSIAAYWTGRYAEALRLTDELLAAGTMPWDFEEAARENRRHCTARLAEREPGGPREKPATFAENLADLAPSLTVGRIELRLDPPWPQYNPSIAAADGGFRMVVRTANYRCGPHGYEFLEDDRTIRTINYLVSLDEGLALRDVAPITEGEIGIERHPTHVLGFEDLRLFHHGGRWLAFANARDLNPEGRAEMVCLELTKSEITSARRLAGPEPRRDEKNWMPFTGEDGSLRLVYSLGPTRILGLEPGSGELAQVSERSAPPRAANLRGGSQGVPTADGTLFCAHEVLPGQVYGRSYVHRLALIRDGALVALSPRLSIVGAELEYCAGLARRGSDLVLSFGVHDAAAGLAVVGESELLACLEPLR